MLFQLIVTNVHLYEKFWQQYTEKIFGTYLSEDRRRNLSNKKPYSKDEIFVTSPSFEMEPECYGKETGSPGNITQNPFENILDEFDVYVTDFCSELNEKSEITCYQEFGSEDLSAIQKLRKIIEKRFYAVPYMDEKDGNKYYRVIFK